MNIKRKLFGFFTAALLPFVMSGTANAGLSDGLAGYWTFDEGVGIVANDVSGNGNTGAINGSANFGPGHVNTGLYFNGNSQNVVIPDSASLNPTTGLTISAFVQADVTTGDIVSKDGELTERQYMINIAGGRFRAHVGTTTGFWVFDGASIIAPGSQHHVAMTYNGGWLKLFVDGKPDGAWQVSGTILPTTQPVRIGGGAPTGTGQLFFTGGIDEVKIYNRALADCEVARLAGSMGLCLLPAVKSTTSPSNQYQLIDPELSQDIVVDNAHNNALGMAWLPNGNMLRRSGNTIYEYTVDQSRLIYSTPVYNIAASRFVPGLSTSGYGITNGTDGYIYANDYYGLYRIDPISWTATRVGPYGYYYGIGTLPDGRIVNEGNFGNTIYVYNPATGVQSIFHNTGTFTDDLTTTDTGYVILATLNASQVRVLDSNGNYVNVANVRGYTGVGRPDGMAYADGSIYSANTDGSISRYDSSGPNFTGSATETIVAANGAYGDLSSVGPDGAFYITTNALRYDDGGYRSGWGVVRISKPGGFSTPPGVPANKPPVADAGAAQTVECTGASSANATLAGTASDPDNDSLTLTWSWNGSVQASGVNVQASFPLGTTQVTLSVDDGNGHVVTSNTSVTVQDTTAPTVNAGPDVALEATSTSGAAYDVAAQSSATDTCCSVATSVSPAGVYPLGTTPVTVSATDCSGNTGSATMNVTVVDTTAPALNLPANVVAEATGILSPVGIGAATASDIFAVSISSDAPVLFVLGDTLVHWTATDANGNVSTGTQTVTVQDTTAPVLNVPADVSVEANGVLSTVDLGVATATDIFGATVTNDAPATFALGTTVVTWTATDSSGLTSTGTQNVTVADTTAPVLNVPADVSVEANGVLSTVDLGVATATDIFGATVTNDAPATFALGTTVVTWTATDSSGLTSTGTQNVTVVDTTAPAVTASLVQVSGSDEDEASFQVVFTATDIADPNPVQTATLNGTTVSNGQIVKLEKSKKAEVEMEHGKLQISGLSFSLNVSATDASGNVGAAAAAYAFPVKQEKEEAKKGDDGKKSESRSGSKDDGKKSNSKSRKRD